MPQTWVRSISTGPNGRSLLANYQQSEVWSIDACMNLLQCFVIFVLSMQTYEFQDEIGELVLRVCKVGGISCSFVSPYFTTLSSCRQFLMVSSAFYHLTRCSKSWAIAGRYVCCSILLQKFELKKQLLLLYLLHNTWLATVCQGITESVQLSFMGISLRARNLDSLHWVWFVMLCRKLDCGISSWKRRL